MNDTLVMPHTMTDHTTAAGDSFPAGNVRFDGELLEKARFVIFHRVDDRGRRMKISQYIDSICRAIIERDYADEVARQAQTTPRRKKKDD